MLFPFSFSVRSAYICHRCCIWETANSMQSMHFILPVVLTFTNCLDCTWIVHIIMSAESFDWNTDLNWVEVIHDLMDLSLFTAHYYGKISITANKTIVTEFRFITNMCVYRLDYNSQKIFLSQHCVGFCIIDSTSRCVFFFSFLKYQQLFTFSPIFYLPKHYEEFDVIV